MKEIILTQGQVALVDDEDFALVSGYKWHACYRKNSKTYVARGLINGVSTLMHRFIMGVVDPKTQVDHKYHNTLDNRKENLRLATSKQNARNQLARRGVSEFKGVSFNSERGRWESKITVDYKTIHLGRFNSEIDAAKAYNEAAKRHFGEFACLNKLSTEQINTPKTIVPTKKLTSQFLGVCWYKQGQKWTCGVYLNRKRIHVGYFDNEKDAAIAYNLKAIEIHGKEAKLNKV